MTSMQLHVYHVHVLRLQSSVVKYCLHCATVGLPLIKFVLYLIYQQSSAICGGIGGASSSFFAMLPF